MRARHGRQSDVVDFRVGAPYRAAGDGDFEFARQIIKIGLRANQLRRFQYQRRSIAQFLGCHARQGAAGDVAHHVSAGAYGTHALGRQRFQNFRDGFDGHPMKLDILPHGDVGLSARMAFRKIRDHAKLPRTQQTVGQRDAQHEVRRSLAFPALAAHGPRAVSLGVNSPPPEIGAQPFRENRIAAIAREFADFFDGFPRILGVLQALGSLRLGLRLGWNDWVRVQFSPRKIRIKTKNPPARFILVSGSLKSDLEYG